MAKLYERLDPEQQALHGSWRRIARMLVVVAVIGIGVWCACAALRWAVHAATELFHHELDETGATLAGAALLAGVVVIGGLLRGLLLRFASWRDTSGDGLDIALDNFHATYARDPVAGAASRFERPTFGLAVKKSVATAMTLGTGGSGGLEAPVVVIGEALGAGVARVFRARDAEELRTYQLSGIAAAVGTLLSAPFAAALFAIEIAYGDRIIYRKFAYALLAALIAYVLNFRVAAIEPVFVAPEHAVNYSLAEYGITAIVAVAVSAPIALGFGLLTSHTARIVGRAGGALRGAAGGAGVAVVALAAWFALDVPPSALLGMGEHTLAMLLGPSHVALWLLAVLLVGKMLTTGFTIGSGGSAGMLIPSMFLGGVSGRLTAEALILSGIAPSTIDPAIFVVVGIASALVAVVGVPLAAIALVLEVFGRAYGPPAALACGMTYVLTLRIKVYNAQRMSADV